MISFIVSTYNSPIQLAGCLSALYLQTPDKEIIVCDNSPDTLLQQSNEFLCSRYNARHLNTSADCPNTCYHDPAKVGAIGEWLCWPSDDGYYVPGFAKHMLNAATVNNWELVYCDMVYDPRLSYCTRGVEEYSVMITAPVMGRIDKTCFMVTRRAFDAVGGWPKMSSEVWADGVMVCNLVQAGVKYGKAPGVMVFHN